MPQLLPQIPQLFVSVCTFVHTLLHKISPDGHAELVCLITNKAIITYNITKNNIMIADIYSYATFTHFILALL